MIRVAAGVVRDESGRVLLSQRSEGKHLAGTWEFPGGKCEDGESAENALKRELAEELGIEIDTPAPFLTLTHGYDDRTIRLLLYSVERFRGEPAGCEGQALDWVEPEALGRMAMPAADRSIIKALNLEPVYAITPDPEQVGGAEAVLDWARSRLDQGIRLLQFRAHSLDASSLAGLARRFGELVTSRGGRWLLNGPAETAMAAGADGVHLTTSAMDSLESRPIPEDRLVMTSCHTPDELRRAGRVGADFVTLSPVCPTASHPETEALGWEGFADLCRQSPLPVFALGGVGPEDLDTAREHGAFGVAGITAFGRS